MIFTMGEALIDFIPEQKGLPLKDVNSFIKAPGGAPANVACAIAKLGGKSAFIGKLGEDAFGSFLTETMAQCGVDTSRILYTNKANTSLAFVSLKHDGNREFTFYRNPGADMLLSEHEIQDHWFSRSDILHFGSVGLIEAPIKSAHKKAIQAIKAKGGLVSFDPNVRLPLWKSPEDCRKAIIEFLPYADILKISDEELEFITGISNPKEAVASLFKGDVKAIAFTKGRKGAEFHTRDFSVSVSGICVEAVDTTGAGDAFIGSLLYKLVTEDFSLLQPIKERALEIIAYANTVAALTITRKGAISSLPTQAEVTEFLLRNTGC
ncbi:MAG: PfkB family carbohydrate kinase [Clostridia bacterium]|nr:PfkB family carbohydrate kinase [Clostridia bacterium]